MTKVIGVFGRKGGSGKSMISHLLCHGVAKLGGKSIMVQTDVRTKRPPEITESREFMLASVPNEGDPGPTLIRSAEWLEDKKNGVMVIDGGANRRNVDLKLSSLCDMILIPTSYGYEDMEVTQDDYDELTAHLHKINHDAEVFIVLNRWPGESRKRLSIENKPWIADFLNKWDRLGAVFPDVVNDMSSFTDMAHGDAPKYSLLIDKKAKDFAQLVTGRLGMEFTDETAPVSESVVDDNDDAEPSSDSNSHQVDTVSDQTNATVVSETNKFRKAS